MPLEPIGPMIGRAVEKSTQLATLRAGALSRSRASSTPPRKLDHPSSLDSTARFSWRSPGRRTPRVYASMGKAAAESATVPCGLIFNECPREDWVMLAVDTGFNLVMLADPEADLGRLTARVAAITLFAHAEMSPLKARSESCPMARQPVRQPAHGGFPTDPEGPPNLLPPPALICWPSAWATFTSRPSEIKDLIWLCSSRSATSFRPTRFARRNRHQPAIAPRCRRARCGQGEFRHLSQTAISCRGSRCHRVR